MMNDHIWDIQTGAEGPASRCNTDRTRVWLSLNSPTNFSSEVVIMVVVWPLPSKIDSVMTIIEQAGVYPFVCVNGLL